jgi:hypothetical protein
MKKIHPVLYRFLFRKMVLAQHNSARYRGWNEAQQQQCCAPAEKRV